MSEVWPVVGSEGVEPLMEGSGMVVASVSVGRLVASVVADPSGVSFKRDGEGSEFVEVGGSEVMDRGWEVCSLEMESIFFSSRKSDYD